PGMHLPEGEQGCDILWALLRSDDRVECGSGYLLALKSGEKARDLLESMIVDILRNLAVAFPRDIYRDLVNICRYRSAEATVHAALIRYIEKGVVRRLPGSLYCLPFIDDTLLINALQRYDPIIRRTIEDPNIVEYPLDNLDLLARYFYQQGL